MKIKNKIKEGFILNNYFILIVTSLLTLPYNCISQSNNLQFDEGLKSLKNDEIRKEMSFFTITGSKINNVDSINIKLIEIPLSKCNDTIAIFEKGNFISIDKLVDIFISDFTASKHQLIFENNKLISIDGKKYWGAGITAPKKEIRAIRILHGKINIRIPQESYTDLFDPIICSCLSNKNKCKSSFKVFQTLDYKRLYIYMFNNTTNSKYEVSWVIENNKYLMRVIDPIE